MLPPVQMELSEEQETEVQVVLQVEQVGVETGVAGIQAEELRVHQDPLVDLQLQDQVVQVEAEGAVAIHVEVQAFAVENAII